jgi:hypothetical protein
VAGRISPPHNNWDIARQNEGEQVGVARAYHRRIGQTRLPAARGGRKSELELQSQTPLENKPAAGLERQSLVSPAARTKNHDEDNSIGHGVGVMRCV